MFQWTPEVFGIVALAVTAIAVMAFVFYRRSQLFQGMPNLRRDVLQLARLTFGRLSRTGDDLVMTGRSAKRDLQVRFSIADDRPGLVIQFNARSGVVMRVMPRSMNMPPSADAKLFRVTARDAVFNQRCQVWASKPLDANRILDSGCATQFQKLCTSSNVTLEISADKLEFSELLIPEQGCAQRLAGEIKLLSEIAEELERIYGKPAPQPTTHRTMKFAAVAAVVVIAAALLIWPNSKAAAPAVDPSTSIPTEDIALIPDHAGWRLADRQDLRNQSVPWLQGVTPVGRLAIDLSPDCHDRCVADVLVNDAQAEQRVVLIMGQKKVYDANVSDVAYMGRITPQQMGNIAWKTPPNDPTGDGLLLVQHVDAKLISLVLYWDGTRILPAVPASPDRLVQ